MITCIMCGRRIEDIYGDLPINARPKDFDICEECYEEYQESKKERDNEEKNDLPF